MSVLPGAAPGPRTECGQSRSSHLSSYVAMSGRSVHVTGPQSLLVAQGPALYIGHRVDTGVDTVPRMKRRDSFLCRDTHIHSAFPLLSRMQPLSPCTTHLICLIINCPHTCILPCHRLIDHPCTPTLRLIPLPARTSGAWRRGRARTVDLHLHIRLDDLPASP